MTDLELSPSVFSILSALIEERAGLHYGLLDRDILQQKASARARDAGFESLLDYYYFLRYDDPDATEFRELIEALVVNETYFFREWAPIESLVDTFIAPRCKSGEKLRIWSAASSTGEEALSLAMILDDRGLLPNVSITATDISARVLERARSGVFGKRSIRGNTAPHFVSKYLEANGNGYTISNRLVDAINWQQQNLLAGEHEWRPLGIFDVILCRNVLIYFADDTVRTVFRHTFPPPFSRWHFISGSFRVVTSLWRYFFLRRKKRVFLL